ncbi:MAG: hypothetical protein CVU05_12070 [Bacteroidetes bacterium HGW-Bacteroidetes-21]|jgi:hypothetical protein|nr:MAG: hypothetical protein CVU05_12070 [Bacteroidetes bacterium HGW-Bacteroidetes-21]
MIYTSLVLLLSLLIIGGAQAQKKKILFIGNSYTYVNDLPNTLYQLALSGEDTIQYDSSAPGGYTFEQHAVYPATLAKITQDNWDYVILQEQSQLPSFPPDQVEVEVYPFARKLDSLIHANHFCSQTMFFMTWGRKYGDAINCPYYPPLCSFEGMNQRLRESYLEMGVMNEAEVAPVGAAWQRSRMADSTLDLWSSDYSHPSVAGTYLTACVFYSSVYKKPCTGLPFISSLTAAQALFLQQIADSTVLDSLPNWYIGEFVPQAAFSWSSNENNVNFYNQSTHASLTWWNFGDGNTSTELNPTHEFSNPGTFQIQLIVSDSCTTDTITQEIQIYPTLVFKTSLPKIEIFPIPFSDQITICFPAIIKELSIIRIYSPDGKKVLEKEWQIQNNQLEHKLNTSALPDGIYLIQIITKTSCESFTSIKKSH